MKKWYIFTILLLLIALIVTACSKKDNNLPMKNGKMVVPNVKVNITVAESGYYSTQTRFLELDYEEGKITEITVTDPTLLAFRVSEYWEGGARIYHGNEIEGVIEELETLNFFYESEDLADIIDLLHDCRVMIDKGM